LKTQSAGLSEPLNEESGHGKARDDRALVGPVGVVNGSID
jgi:hypothetical protein